MIKKMLLFFIHFINFTGNKLKITKNYLAIRVALKKIIAHKETNKLLYNDIYCSPQLQIPFRFLLSKYGTESVLQYFFNRTIFS